MSFKGEDTVKDYSKKNSVSQNEKNQKITKRLFQVTIAVYVVWFLIPFYVRPYTIGISDFFAKGISVLSLLFTLAAYIFVKVVVQSPTSSLQQYRDKLRPAIAGTTILVTIIFAAIYINWIPEIGAERQAINKTKADALALSSPSPAIQATPETTAAPTESATPEATATTVPVDGSVIILIYNTNKSIKSKTISPNFRVVNSGKSELKLSDLKVRYYFTSYTGDTLTFSVVSTSAKEDNAVTGNFVPVVQESNYYLELGFSEGASSLQPGQIFDVKTKIDGVNITPEASDGNPVYSHYSFNKESIYTAWKQCPAYLGGNLIWGEEPTK